MENLFYFGSNILNLVESKLSNCSLCYDGSHFTPLGRFNVTFALLPKIDIAEKLVIPSSNSDSKVT